MSISRFTRILAAGALALGAAGIAQAAHARTDVYFSVGVPAPVYSAPQPVYVAPPAAVYSVQAPVYAQPGYDDWRWRREELRRDEWRREHWRKEQWRREQWRRWQEAHGDRYYPGDWR